jgi:hypothetical protein
MSPKLQSSPDIFISFTPPPETLERNNTSNQPVSALEQLTFHPKEKAKVSSVFSPSTTFLSKDTILALYHTKPIQSPRIVDMNGNFADFSSFG